MRKGSLRVRVQEKERNMRLKRYERTVLLFNDAQTFVHVLATSGNQGDNDRLAKVVQWCCSSRPPPQC